MRILLITVFPPMKSPEATHALYLCEHLAKHGLDVHVLTAKNSIKRSHHGVTIYPVVRDWSWSDLPHLVRYIKRCSPDGIILIYIGWIYDNHPMITFAPTISKALLPRVPFITLFENVTGAHYPTSLFARVVRKAMKLWAGGRNVDDGLGTLLRDSDRIIVLSEAHRARLAERFPGVNAKSVLIPAPPLMRICPENNGAVRLHGRKKIGVTPSEFLLIHYGYFYPGKGVETLLKAVQIVCSRWGEVRLLMVGGGLNTGSGHAYAQEMYELSGKLGIDGNVIWAGECPWDSNEASVYHWAADACILPFDSGVYLNNSSFAAAATHGLPIITTRGTIVEKPFCHRENVYMCRPRDPEAMAMAIEELMDDRELREHLQAGALDLAQEWFSWKSAIERTMATLRSVIECKSA